jgi:transposase
MDLWSPYKSLVEELMPNANITADRFHVMKQVNDELDAMRKSEKKAAMDWAHLRLGGCGKNRRKQVIKATINPSQS